MKVCSSNYKKWTLPIIPLIVIISLLLFECAVGYYAASVTINSSGTIALAIQYPQIYESEEVDVFVGCYPQVYDNSKHCNWTLIAETLAAYNVTGIVTNLVYNYKVYYTSRFSNVVGESQSGRDEIVLAAEAAHRFGLRLAVSFCVLYKSPKDEWKVKLADGSTYNWLDPTNPQARQHILNLVEEIVTNYNIDELNLDYIRYDGEDMPYTETARQQLSQYLGETITNWPGPFAPGGSRYSEFLQWRIIPINTLVKEIYELAKSIKPNITISACTRYWAGHPGWALASIGQDPTTWIKDGYLDKLMPMTYRDTVPEVELSIETYLDYAIGGPEGMIPLVPILSTFTYDETGDKTISQFAEQVTAVRNLGCDGIAICAYDGPGAANYPSESDIRPYLQAMNLTRPWKLQNITVQFLGRNAVKISWETTRSTTSKVEYNVTNLFVATQEYIEPSPYPGIYCWDMNYRPGIIFQNTTFTIKHEITLTNLQANTYYYFRIQSKDSSCSVTSKVYTFKL
jgi:hypothetical protein